MTDSRQLLLIFPNLASEMYQHTIIIGVSYLPRAIPMFSQLTERHSTLFSISGK